MLLKINTGVTKRLKQIIKIVKINNLKITSAYSFLYLSAFLAAYIRYAAGKAFEATFVFWGILIYVLYYFFASIKKRNEKPIFSVGIVAFVFSIFLDKFPRGSSDYLYIFFELGLFTLIVFIDFLFLEFISPIF